MEMFVLKSLKNLQALDAYVKSLRVTSLPLSKRANNSFSRAIRKRFLFYYHWVSSTTMSFVAVELFAHRLRVATSQADQNISIAQANIGFTDAKKGEYFD